MIVPTSDDLKAHGLWSLDLEKAIVAKMQADFELSMAMGALPLWYLARLECLEAMNAPECWTDEDGTARGLAKPRRPDAPSAKLPTAA
jgi:hypothetical protein